MKLAMPHMRMTGSMDENLKTSLAMCNRVGLEGEMDFAGQSIVVHPSGDVIVKADNAQRLVNCEIDIAEAELWRGKRPYISTRRKDMYL